MVVSVDKATALKMYDYVQIHWSAYKNNLIKERAKDMVKEASIPSELIEGLAGLLKLCPNGGVEWTTKLPALPPPKSK